MSFLYKRADSPYWHAGVNVDGRWVQRSLGVSSRKAAAAKLRKLEQALADGEPAFVDGAPDLAETLSAYVEYCEARNRPKTMLEKRRFVKRYEAFFGAARAVPSVRQADVEAYVADRLTAGAGAPVINRELATLKIFFNLAIARGFCKANPVRGIKPLPEARRPIKIIPYKVLDKYFDWCRKNDPLLCEQMVSQASRRSGLWLTRG